MSETPIVPIPETPVPDKPLGRHIQHDPASRSFQAERAPSVQSVVHRAWGLPLTQTVGSCTAEALVGACNSHPNYDGTQRPGMPREQPFAMQLYAAECQLEGSSVAEDPGGTGLMVCEAGQKLAIITAYHTAFGLQHALEALTLVPVITGTNWYDSMDTPDANGVVTISPGAQVRGGHEFLADEIDVVARLVWFWNSWGKTFGKEGRFAMSFDTWDRLLGEQGDVTVPIV